MEKHLGGIKSFAKSVVEQARMSKASVAVLTAIFLLQFYFVRELLVAELLFGFGFAVVVLLGGPAYIIGSLGIEWFEQPRRNQSNVIPLVERNRALERNTDLTAGS